MTVLLMACILLAPSAPQTEIGEPLVSWYDGGAAGSRAGLNHRPVTVGLTPDRDASDGLELRDVPPASTLPDTATVVEGKASWFCRPGVSRCTSGYPASGAYAAAGPALRVGDWRGRVVTVTSGGRSIRVTLSDWCQCPDKVIDLYASQFQRLAPLSRGVIPVQVSWGGGAPATLPPTSTGDAP
jgi:hypothetical protein